MCAIHLPLKLLDPGTPPPHVGQLIGLRRPTVQRSLRAIVCRQSAVVGGPSTFLRRRGAIVRRCGAIVRRPLTVARGSGNPFSSPHRPGRLDRVLPRLRAGIPHIGYLIALRCDLVTLIGCDFSRHRGSQTSARLLISKLRRMPTMHSAHVTNLLIGPRGGFPIAGDLIRI